MKINWRQLTAGQKLLYSYDEFDGRGAEICTVAKVYDDHAIAANDGIVLWVDDDTEHMFSLL